MLPPGVTQGCLLWLEGLTYSHETGHLGTVLTSYPGGPSSSSPWSVRLAGQALGRGTGKSWCRSSCKSEGVCQSFRHCIFLSWCRPGTCTLLHLHDGPRLFRREETSERHALLRAAALFRARESGAGTGLTAELLHA